ncbi:cubilin-like [Petromyzon marinus]|uniref:cubilin-like n=1 Tax=Petromyzon marinus TaxID=7757 RepID=UPI003F70BD9F
MRSMRIEDDPTCRWDFVEVRFTGREPTRLCGSDMSRVPNGGVMQGRGETVIYLQSDDSVNDAGFLLNYEGTLAPCRGLVARFAVRGEEGGGGGGGMVGRPG